MGKQIFDILKDAWNGPQTETVQTAVMEDKVYNPLKLRVGNILTIDTIDLAEHPLRVKAIRELQREHGDPAVDYLLEASPYGAESFSVLLRLLPDPEKKYAVPYRCLALTLHEEFAYCRDVENAANDPTGIFIITNHKTGAREEYQLVMKNKCRTLVLTDADGSGTIEAGEAVKSTLDYWHFQRQTTVDGVEVQQQVFVEVDENKWMQIRPGQEVHPKRISAS